MERGEQRRIAVPSAMREAAARPAAAGALAGLGALARRVADTREAIAEHGLARALPYLALGAMLAGFGWWYGSVLLSIPIFGDATVHAYISRSILEDGIWDTPTTYPSFYHVFGALFLAIGGDTGFRLLTVFSLLLLAGGTYALSHELSKSHVVALVATLLALIAPQTVFYTGRFYMEILLSGLIVWSVWFFARYLRIGSTRELIACAVFTALAAATKQQALVLLVPAIGFVLLARAAGPALRDGLASARQEVRHVAAFTAVVAAIAVPAYLSLIHSQGAILPEFGLTAPVNAAVRATTGLDGTEPAWQTRWDERLDASFDAAGGDQGFTNAEARHIWPTDTITSQRGFFGIHTLFWFERPAVQYPDSLAGLMFALFSLGAIAWAWRARKTVFFWFLALFLLMNYVSFIRNNDQIRYHLYLSFLMAFFIPFGLTAAGWLGDRSRLMANAALVALLALAVFMTLHQFPSRLDSRHGGATLQAYAGSAGGIASIQETGTWLEANSEEDETFFAVPHTEIRYYAQREGFWDYRAYFLGRDELARLFEDMGVTYIVIPHSAVQPDDAWSNVVKTPSSFYEKIAQLYPIAYKTAAGDITVFTVR